MRITLRSLILAPALMAAAAFTPQTAVAAAATVRVPFNFVANGKTMPAGVYYIERNDNSTLVTLTSPDRKQSYIWLLTPGNAQPETSGAALSFDKANGTFMLRAIQYDELSTGKLDKRILEAPAVHVAAGR
jgi:hypothetical protein